jgi:hypothetical protein
MNCLTRSAPLSSVAGKHYTAATLPFRSITVADGGRAFDVLGSESWDAIYEEWGRQ